jgi:hypothetical protein
LRHEPPCWNRSTIGNLVIKQQSRTACNMCKAKRLPEKLAANFGLGVDFPAFTGSTGQ